jgi:magnesium transporter
MKLPSPSTVADLIEKMDNLPQHQQAERFREIPHKKANLVFEYLPSHIQHNILKELPPTRIAELLNALPPDDRTALFADLPKERLNRLLQYLSPEEKAVSLRLLGYPENSVGRLMTPDYIAVGMDWSVKKALDHIRKRGKDSETINVIYVLDEEGKLIDDFPIRQFILSPGDTKIEELANHQFIALKVMDDEETAISAFRKFSRVALPVVDDLGVMLGIVTIDDIMQITIEKDTEDIHRIGGTAALKEPYMSAPFFSLMKKRAGWLLLLFLGEMLTATAMGFFQDEIARAVVLALFLPLIISSGGNAGSQASTLIIRALALEEVTFRDWWKIMKREIYSGLFLGIILGLVGFFRISLWGAATHAYGAHPFLLGFTVFFALLGVILWGTLSGSMFPLILKKLGFDPAVASAPFVATLVDVCGIVIYFSIAYFLLKGTLL